MNTIDFGSMLGLEKAREEEPPPYSLAEFLKHLSASSIGMLYRCPRQFQHRYLRHEKERPGGNLVIGGMFHKTLEWNYKQKIKSFEDRPLAQAIEYLQDAATPMILDEHGGAGEIAWDTNLEDACSDAERITAAYYRTVVPRIQPVATEQKFSVDIPGVEVPVIGYVDVQEELRTVDTKTGKQATRKVKPSWALQGRLYSLATQKPTEYHSISRAKTPTIVTAMESSEMVVPVPSQGQVVEMVRLVNTAADLIRYFLATFGLDQEWPQWGAVPDWSRNVLPCSMCGWSYDCPMWVGTEGPPSR